MPSNEKKENVSQALDLIGGTKRRRAPQAEETTTPTSSPAPAAKLDAVITKPAALDLLAKKPARRAATPEPVKPVADEPKPVEETGKSNETDTVDAKSIKAPIILSELAAIIGVKPFKLIGELLKHGVFGKPEMVLDAETVSILCESFGIPFEREKREKGAGIKAQPEIIQEPAPVLDEPEDTLKLRTPIITIMGHVDHGKTSLLDYIRREKVAAGEAGGITQHIGAYSVERNGQTLTFIDTPGHAIFTEMRARGADVTDIVVIVIAANDGVMPQTKEAIQHSKAAGKTIIIAVNKCDLPSADPMRARSGLMEAGLVPTDFGGDIECIDVSALTGEGVDDLLDLLVLQAEVLELRANPKGNCRASIIEARMEQGKGSSATVIVQCGTLKVGTPFICGPYAGKVRTMFNDKGQAIKRATPGMPVEVSGFAETPNVGDELVEMESERSAKKLSEERLLSERQNRLATPRKTRMEDILAVMGDGEQKAQLKLFLKGDVQGSVEAIKNAIMEIKSDKVECVFLGASAGSISETDIILASSSNAIILGFNVKIESNAVRIVKREGVQVKLYSIVYELIDQVRDAMLGLLEPETRETIIGHCEVRQVFKLNKGKAAGAYVSDGKVQRTCEARVLRGGQAVFDGKMSTLRRFQDEVEEVKAGLECGIRLGEYNEYEEGDIIECYTLERIAQKL